MRAEISWLVLALATSVSDGSRPSREDAGASQEPTLESRHGAVSEEGPEVESPELLARFGMPLLGHRMAWTVEEEGAYELFLRSFAFDAYLLVLDEEGRTLVADDDGWYGFHARGDLELDAGSEIAIWVCSVDGRSGPFSFHGKRRSGGADGDGEPSSRADYEGQLAIAEAIPEERLDWTVRVTLGHAMELEERGRTDRAGQLIARAESEVERASDAPPEVRAEFHALLAKALRVLDEEASATHLARAEELERMRFESAGHGSADAELELLVQLASWAAAAERTDLARRHLRLALALDSGLVDPTLAAGAKIDLAYLLLPEEQFEEAAALLEEVVIALEPIPGAEELVAEASFELGITLLEDDRPARALVALQRVRELAELGLAPTVVPDDLDAFLVRTYLALGEFERARRQADRLRARLPDFLELDDPLDLLLLHDVPHLIGVAGFVEDELLMREHAVAVAEAKLPLDDPVRTAMHSAYASVLSRSEGPATALPQYELALDSAIAAYGDDHEEVARCRLDLAFELTAAGAGRAALEQVDAVLDSLARLPEEREAVRSLAHSGRAAALQLLGRHVEAVAEQRAALEFSERSLGAEAYDTALLRRELAATLSDAGRGEEAVSVWLESMRAILAILDRELPSMSEAGRMVLLEEHPGPAYLLDVVDAGVSLPLEELYELQLEWKGKATRLQEAAQRLLQRRETAEVRKLQAELATLDREIAILTLHLPDSPAAEGALEDELHERRRRRLDLERQRNHELGHEELLATPSLDTVRSALQPSTVLLDFTVGASVHVWVVRGERPIELYSLGSTEELRSLLDRYLRGAIARGGSALPDANDARPGDELAAWLWTPLAAAVGDAERVFVSPDGLVCELPFGVLPAPQPEGAADEPVQFLLEAHRFHYLGDATRLVVPARDEDDREGPILALGDVDYFRRAPLMERAHDGEVEPPTASLRSRLGDRWTSLAATRVEVQTLADLHEHVLRWDASFARLVGADATEEAVRAAVGGKRYVHLATHGFFEPESLPSVASAAAVSGGGPASLAARRTAARVLPGLLSGLVLAGVNGEPDPSREDGFLSAQEVQTLDLSACDLAVLSACETALGSARAGEGMISLRRAFTVAGARSVVSSLWQVDDRATAELMGHFYVAYWERGRSKLDALHEAKLRVLHAHRVESGGDGRPHLWGAFVLSGDWR